MLFYGMKLLGQSEKKNSEKTLHTFSHMLGWIMVAKKHTIIFLRLLPIQFYLGRWSPKFTKM
jgi:hypothetical protein